METKVEALQDNKVKVTVTVDAKEVDNRIKKAYKDFGKKYKFPGFRPGHVPRQIIDANLGKEAVLSTVTDEMLNESFPVAIDEADLILISEPKFSEVDGLVEEGKDFTFSIECEVKPAFELSDYSPVHIEVPFKTASEAEIDREIDNLGNAYHDYKNAPANTKVKADSVVELDIKAVDDNGEELMRDRMWKGDVYFLCRENGRDMLLQYSLFEGKNQDAISYCDYYYGLHTFDGGKLNIVENNNTSIYLNWDGTQNGDWGESQQAFAARVNELIDQSKFLIAQQDGELILTSEVQRWYCVSPKTIRVAMDDTTIYIDRKSWDFAEQYPSLKGFEDIGTAGNYFVAFGSLGEKNDLYVVFNFVAGTLLKTFPGNNLIWQGNDLFTAVYSYWSDIYALNGTKLAALELASGEEISGLAFAPDGVSIIATVSGKSGERKVTVTREGSA